MPAEVATGGLFLCRSPGPHPASEFEEFDKGIVDLARALAVEANRLWEKALNHNAPHHAPDDSELTLVFAEIIAAHSGEPAAGEKAE